MVLRVLEVDRLVICGEEKQLKYKIPGFESVWFTQSCHMALCHSPSVLFSLFLCFFLGCAISEKSKKIKKKCS